MTVYSGTNADGRKLLRIEARNAETPIERKPPWIKTRMRTGPEYQRIKELVGNEVVRGQRLHAVRGQSTPGEQLQTWIAGVQFRVSRSKLGDTVDRSQVVGADLSSSPIGSTPPLVRAKTTGSTCPTGATSTRGSATSRT